VYPDWRGDEEWSDLDDKTASKYDVTHMTWSEWLKVKQDFNVVASFACRSSAWTPPHLDGEWMKFLESWHSLPYHCLECTWAPETLGQGNVHHACTPREWDMEAVEYERSIMAEAMKRQRDRA
jgi:hypothetical protein